MLPLETMSALSPRTGFEGYGEGGLARAVERLVSPLYLDLGGDHHDAVFVAGSGRSGTTWISELANRRLGYRYVFEPFHPGEVPLARPFGYRRYIKPGESQPELQEAARSIVSGRVRGPWTDRFHRRFVSRGRLIKDIRANLFLGWLADSFPEMPVILILRHPCAVALSKVRLGWRARLEEFLAQPELVRDFLAPVAERMRAACTDETPEFERHVFAWCVETAVPLAQLGPGRAHLVFYESLCESPEEELRELFRYLGSEPGSVSPDVLRSPSSLSRPGSAVLSSADPVASWREELSAEESRRAVEILGLFGLDRVYGESPRPGVEAARGLLEGVS